MKALAIFGWVVLLVLCAVFAACAWIGTTTEFGRATNCEVLIAAGLSFACGLLAWIGRPSK